jgi:hypothetical protein
MQHPAIPQPFAGFFHHLSGWSITDLIWLCQKFKPPVRKKLRELFLDRKKLSMIIDLNFHKAIV